MMFYTKLLLVRDAQEDKYLWRFPAGGLEELVATTMGGFPPGSEGGSPPSAKGRPCLLRFTRSRCLFYIWIVGVWFEFVFIIFKIIFRFIENLVKYSLFLNKVVCCFVEIFPKTLNYVLLVVLNFVFSFRVLSEGEGGSTEPVEV